MQKIIKNNALVEDAWYTVSEPAPGENVEIPSSGAVIVPLSVWKNHREALLARHTPLGLLVEGDTEPTDITPDLSHFGVIAVYFPNFGDGRGYSLARLLRERHGYTGEIRAIGDVLRDQLFYLARCGFDAFVIRADRDAAEALASLADFTEVYQAAVLQPNPLFRRRLPA